MEELYIYRGAKKLRCGYTTGTCAAAASKAAAEMLLSGKKVSSTELVTPSGNRLTLSIEAPELSEDHASCSVIKKSGDDPDVTDGIRVCADIYRTAGGIEITGGEGVGTVTKPGLDQPVGESAINSVPRRMITEAVREMAELYEYSGGFRIIISVPHGRELARKTFNPRMGIVGGISIIGTTGIVEPMSSRALVETIRTEANMRKAAGYRYLLLTVGNYSEDFIKLRAGDLSERTVTCSNFIGEALDIGLSLGFEGILLIGHMGKLVKLGSGIMNTHSTYADGRMETLMACGVLAGADNRVLSQLAGCAVTDAALDILYSSGEAEKVLSVLAERIGYYMSARVRGEILTGAVVFSEKHGLTLKTGSADKLIELISEE